MQYMDVLLSYTESSDPEQVFQLLDILGQGAYGSVSKALHKQTGQLYAIKILPATSVNQISVIKKQIAILRQCNNQHIVKYYGSYFKDNYLWIVMQYCMAGSITDIVNITQKQLNEYQIAAILELVLKGLHYLHERKKIHRDIKAANILLDQNGTAKLADFGVSTQMMYTNARHNTHIGSPYWMSPEVIKYSQYNQKTDIWSLGVTAIELAEGIVPYSHLKPFMAMWTMKDKPIQSFKQPQKWSLQFNDFIKQCLQINPQMRPSAQELLKHDFIRKFSKGQKILCELVMNSMAEIQHFRAKQQKNFKQQQSGNQQINFDKRQSYNSQYQTLTVIHKNNKGSGSIIQNNSSNLKSFKGSDSVLQYGFNDKQNYTKNQQYNDEDVESGSVIFKGQNGHSRQCSEVSVSSVLVKNNEPGQKNNQKQNNYLQSYVKNLQNIYQKEQQFKQNIQQKINLIEKTFIRTIQDSYINAKLKLEQFFEKNNQNPDEIKIPNFQSSLFHSPNLLQYLFNHTSYQPIRQKIANQYEQKFLQDFKPNTQDQDSYHPSMMLDSYTAQNDNDQNEHQYPQRKTNGLFLSQNIKQKNLYRKKSQSSADSPSSIYHNNKPANKKLIIRQDLQYNKNNNSNQFQQYQYEGSEQNQRIFNKSIQGTKKQNSIKKYIQKTPVTNQSNMNGKNYKFKQIQMNSATFNNTANNKSLISTINYGNSTAGNNSNNSNNSSNNYRGVKKMMIITQPHQNYQYDDNNSISTQSKIQRNFKQFYQDPVVMNNLKQLTQQSDEFVFNPFEIKKSSFSKQIKSVKSKQKQKQKFLRQKERATHIAHIAMAKDRNITNSNKKLKVIKVYEKQKQKSPEDSQTIKSKSKKAKSKNKQTASTTIPFGSTGNIAAFQFVPLKLGKSKQKKVGQNPIKSGPFSKVKQKN